MKLRTPPADQKASLCAAKPPADEERRRDGEPEHLAEALHLLKRGEALGDLGRNGGGRLDDRPGPRPQHVDTGTPPSSTCRCPPGAPRAGGGDRPSGGRFTRSRSAGLLACWVARRCSGRRQTLLHKGAALLVVGNLNDDPDRRRRRFRRRAPAASAMAAAARIDAKGRRT